MVFIPGVTGPDGEPLPEDERPQDAAPSENEPASSADPPPPPLPPNVEAPPACDAPSTTLGFASDDDGPEAPPTVFVPGHGAAAPTDQAEAELGRASVAMKPMGRPSRMSAVLMTTMSALLLAGALGIFFTQNPRLASASDDPSWHSSLDAGLAEAKAEHRPLLMLFTADWCPACTQLEEGALSSPEIEELLETRFVKVKVDLSESGGPAEALAREHGVRSIPTMEIYHPSGYELGRHVGGGSPTVIRELLRRAAENVD